MTEILTFDSLVDTFHEHLDQLPDHRPGRNIRYEGNFNDAIPRAPGRFTGQLYPYMEEVKLDMLERRRNKERLAPFWAERLDYRHQDQEAFYQGLARNGPKAVEEYRRAFG